MFSLDLVLIMLAVGAAGRAGHRPASAPPVAVQVLVAAGASVGDARAGPAELVKRLHNGPELTLGHGKLVGRRASSPSRSPRQPGRVKLAGEIWSAAPYDDTSTIEPGETVEVFEIRGATAYVHPVPTARALTRPHSQPEEEHR